MDICIIDFEGYTIPGHFHTSFWADYDGEKVIFGGDWRDIPPLVIDHEPTEEEVEKYAYDRILGRKQQSG